MKKTDEAKQILDVLQVPERQQSDICCYTLLALAGVSRKTAWSEATNKWMRIHDILVFLKEKYKATYAENSRETFRKQALHHFRNAAFIEDNGCATNSPNYRYRLTEEMVGLVRTYKSEKWRENGNVFLSKHESLISMYAAKRNLAKLPLYIDGREYTLSSGKHNKLQKAIMEEFVPRFLSGAECLYIGDTAAKDLVNNKERMKEIGFEITVHDKMPDVVLYCAEKNWLIFIEAVASVGPMEPKRIKELNNITTGVKADKIFITAFWDFKEYKRFSELLAWETEVWIAEIPEHMIHLNGDKFLGSCQGKEIKTNE